MANTINVGPSDDPRLRQAVNLVFSEGVEVSQPEGGIGLTQLADYGSINQSNINLFTDEMSVGHLAAPYRPTLAGGDTSDSHVLMLVTGIIPAGYQPLEEVKDEVVRWIAARGQYENLLNAANELVGKAQKTASKRPLPMTKTAHKVED